MLHKIKRLINSILTIFGIQIIKAKAGRKIIMDDALWRAREHQISINTIVDIGAFGGGWSIEAMRYFPQANFLAFEPLEEKKQELEKLKTKYSNFDFEFAAAGDNDNSKILLNVTNDLDGSAVGGKNQGVGRMVPVKRVDTVLQEKNLNGPYLLKFDTHGYELPILEGCKNILKKTNLVIIEAYNFNLTDQSLRFHEMCTHMEELGFRCYDLAGPALRMYDNCFWQIDLFFVPKNSELFDYPHSK